jgi:hypothetical protein
MFNDAETKGFQGAADDREIDFLELLWIQRRGAPHLFRTGQLPPLRGTSVRLDEGSLLLYTRGSIPYFRTYPGMCVPQPLLIRPTGSTTDLNAAAIDVLAVSKRTARRADRHPLRVLHVASGTSNRRAGTRPDDAPRWPDTRQAAGRHSAAVNAS